MRLAIDVMSGDLGPRASVPACMQALERFPFLSLDLYGDVESIQAYTFPLYSQRYRIIDCQSTTVQSDSIVAALKSSAQSSMGRAINALANQEVDGVVSAGNTAALLALSCRLVGCMRDVKRPAICAQLPREDGCFFLLDCGANVSVSPEQLLGFARMGSALAQSVTNIKRPKVALLNVGTEAVKGSACVKEAAALLNQQSSFEYVGFVEGDGFFSSDVDVVVCDGFVGNVALKATEGLALHVRDRLAKSVSSGWRRFLAPVTRLLLSRAVNWLNPHRYNGASFLGLKSVVVKSHGSANSEAFLAAIGCAVCEVEARLPAKISGLLEARAATDKIIQ